MVGVHLLDRVSPELKLKNFWIIVDLKGDACHCVFFETLHLEVSKNSDKWTLHCYTSFFINGSVILEVGGSQKEIQEISDLDRV